MGFTRRFRTRVSHEISVAATRSEPSEDDRLDRWTKVNDRLGLARAAHEHDNYNGSINSGRPGCTNPARSRLVIPFVILMIGIPIALVMRLVLELGRLL